MDLLFFLLGCPLGPDGTDEDFGGMSCNVGFVLKTFFFVLTERFKFTIIVRSPEYEVYEQG